MKTITQETVQGKVESISTKGDYIVKFVLKSIREGETAWINVSSNDWQAWSLREGDEVNLRGQMTSTVWGDPFLNEEIETIEIAASEIRFAA